MNRLTKKNNGTGSWTQFGDKYLPAHNIKHKQCVNKLGQLEDIEEELGIDLITLFKALRDGVYVVCGDIEGNYIEFVENYKLALSVYRKELIVMRDCMPMIKLKDYGKTWALTREGLEDDGEII